MWNFFLLCIGYAIMVKVHKSYGVYFIETNCTIFLEKNKYENRENCTKHGNESTYIIYYYIFTHKGEEQDNVEINFLFLQYIVLNRQKLQFPFN